MVTIQIVYVFQFDFDFYFWFWFWFLLFFETKHKKTLTNNKTKRTLVRKKWCVRWVLSLGVRAGEWFLVCFCIVYVFVWTVVLWQCGVAFYFLYILWSVLCLSVKTYIKLLVSIEWMLLFDWSADCKSKCCVCV